MTVTIHRKEWRWALTWACLIVLLSSLPYFYAWLAAPQGLVFGGLLTNPLDGNSYLAKMRQGWQGAWRFHLPFTPEDHEGAYIFGYYLALGHLARWLGLALPLVYHLARAVNGGLLLCVVYWFFARLEPEVETRRAAFLLTALSSGLGWLVAPLGLLTADLWVPEAITFYAILANAHFALAMALMLVVIGLIVQPGERLWWTMTRALVAALLLAVVQPFAVLGVLAILGGYLVLQAVARRELPRQLARRCLAIGLAVAPVMVYDVWVYTANPALAAWSAQNLTPSPPPWDYALSYGPVLALALFGLPGAIRRWASGDRLAVAWVATIALLLYAPFALQRRLVMGLHFPLCLLAALGLRRLADRWPQRRRLVVGGIVGLSVLSNLFLLLGALASVGSGDLRLFLYRDEQYSLNWLREYAPGEAVVLAAPQTGLLIPAWAGQRVVYGHPYETIRAEEREALVQGFFASPTGAARLLDTEHVDYVFFGPRERALGDWLAATDWPVVYQNETVVILKPGPLPSPAADLEVFAQPPSRGALKRPADTRKSVQTG